MKRLVDWRISDAQLRQYWVYLCVQHQYEDWWRNLSYEQQLDIAYDRWQKEYNFVLTASEVNAQKQKAKSLPTRKTTIKNKRSSGDAWVAVWIFLIIFAIGLLVSLPHLGC